MDIHNEVPMRAQKLDTQVRQEQIAEAALGVVACRGMKGLSVARVARRIGVVPSAIYRHYGSKDEVLDAVLDLIRDRLLANVADVCNESGEALDRLRGLLVRHVRLLRENEGIPRIVFSQELHNGDSGRKARMCGTIREYLGQVAKIVREGQQNGEIRSDSPAEVVAMMFLGVIQPAALLWDLSDGDFDVARHAERAWEILEEAVRPIEGAGRAGSAKQKENVMKATDIMREEHRVIQRVLQCLTAATDRAEKDGTLYGDSIRKMIAFLGEFADRCHHGKEEARFFPIARRRGVTCLPGNIDILLAEHEQGRAHLRAMDENLSAAEKDDAEAKTRFCREARRYVRLLTEHIGKEDNCLFPTADRALTAADQEALVRAFEQMEREEMGEGAHERLHALADELCSRWQVTVPAESGHSGCCRHE